MENQTFDGAPQTPIMRLSRYLGIDLEEDYEAIIKEYLEIELAHQTVAYMSGQMHANLKIEQSFNDWYELFYFPESLMWKNGEKREL